MEYDSIFFKNSYLDPIFNSVKFIFKYLCVFIYGFYRFLKACLILRILILKIAIKESKVIVQNLKIGKYLSSLKFSRNSEFSMNWTGLGLRNEKEFIQDSSKFNSSLTYFLKFNIKSRIFVLNFRFHKK